MRDIVVLDSQSSWGPPHDGHPWADRLEPVDMYDLPAVDLGRYTGLLVEGMVDQEFLYAHRDLITSYLDGGGVVVWSGQLFRPWLPGCGMFTAKKISSFRDYVVEVVTPHPVFEGVDPEDLTFRKGVAGFFARGQHTPPPGAEVVLALAGGEPVVYVDRRTTNGTVLAHAGNGLLGFADPPSTAERIDAQLVDWIVAEGGRR
jgi:hypothetical protein